MFKITNARLDQTSLARLATFQQPINQLTHYPEQVDKAQAQWDTKRQDAVFGTVVSRLIAMCPTGDYCYYCCRSEAGHIDHFQPKNLYPLLTFAWPNFIHACERCNTRHKKERCAVVVAGAIQAELIEVTRPARATVRRPRGGRIALINPRREDALELLTLDIGHLGTFSSQV
jgi:hypothetical protein